MEPHYAPELRNADRITAMKKKSVIILLGAVAVIFAAAVLSALLSRFALTVSRYELTEPALDRPIRIVQLTDLHNSEFGRENRRLVELVAEQKPDLILLTGDLLNQEQERTDVALKLIRKLAAVAPVYASYGNHEVVHERSFGTDFRELYAEAGATVLDFAWSDVTVNGQELRIGGIYGYCLPGKYLKTGEANQEECAFLESFQDTDRTTLLMCHMPVCWVINGSLNAWDVDVVLCGHDHGGQIRLPWIGGLRAPDRGWFPGRECGLYWSADGEKTMVLSRGLGTSGRVPRLNNIPEILVLDLIPGQTA